MKKITIGILAHVDAGKTTLSEALLYSTGQIKILGRVDHQDAFLDYNELERNRKITIFSKQALINWQDVQITLIDTPGHVDFSTEMERTLAVLDYAILLISGTDGIQAHSKTILELLKHYHIPFFVFINKMDITKRTQEDILNELNEHIEGECLNFENQDEHFFETVAMCKDEYLDYYLTHQTLKNSMIISQIDAQKIIPCYFGSALRVEGIKSLLDGISKYTTITNYPDTFGAKVFKVTYENNERLVHLKMTGGNLKTKDKIDEHEKVDQLRIYSGHKYEMVSHVSAGDVCVVKGLNNIYVGDGLGFEKKLKMPVLSSYMNYRLVLLDDVDSFSVLGKIKQLEEEDPQLHIVYNEKLKEINLQLMGEIQTEVLKNKILERFNLNVDFIQGDVLYKETIVKAVEGVGHYEPLRHYAEVHLLLEPGKPGSGLVFNSQCKEDDLAKNYQRLILSHLTEKEHIGVLIGGAITDMKITLVSGKAHLKHTEGGDFRQATYRALRQGLKRTQSIVLEPYYEFRLEIPDEFIGKAIYDIETMNGTFEISHTLDTISVITGKAPVALMQSYFKEVAIYSKGKGKLTCRLKGYEPCIDQEAIIEKFNYDSETDLDNPTGSVFCKHGAGFNVKYDEVENYMHLPYTYQDKQLIKKTPQMMPTKKNVTNEELETIFERTYGKIKRHTPNPMKTEKTSRQDNKKIEILKECLLVDGYNVIYAWEELKKIAVDNLDAARSRLIEILSNYQGYKNCELIIVFDAYKVKGNLGTVQKYGNISIVYTKEAQTADMYIERVTSSLAKQYRVIVATSDALEQLIVISQGARRMSSRELKLEVEHITKTKLEEFKNKQPRKTNYLLEDVKNFNSK